MFLGLRTVIYGTADVTAAKAWYQEVLGLAPYFDEPFYVGFNVGGFELGLDPNATPGGGEAIGPVAYWGVADAEATSGRLVALGARVVEEDAPIRGARESVEANVGRRCRSIGKPEPFCFAIGSSPPKDGAAVQRDEDRAVER